MTLSPCGRPPPVIYTLDTIENTRVLFRSSLALSLLACKRACSPAARLRVFGTPLHLRLRLRLKPSFISSIFSTCSILVLASSSIARRNGCPSGRVTRSTRSRQPGGGVSVAKAHPWKGCSRAVNVVSSNRVIPHTSHRKIGHKPYWVHISW